jgi:hypothetical protein
MSLRYMMDEHLPVDITARLLAAGVDVLTVQEDGAAGMPDVELLERAMALGREMVTQDTDFLVEAARRQRSGIPFCGIFYAHQDERMNRVYAEWLEMYATLENPADVAGRVIFIP